MLMSLQLKKKKKKNRNGGRTYISKETTVEKFPTLLKSIKPQCNKFNKLKQKRHKDDYVKAYQNRITYYSDKEKFLNVVKGKRQRGIEVDSRPCQKQCNPEDSNIFKVLKENRTVNLDLHARQKIFSKYEGEMNTFSNTKSK